MTNLNHFTPEKKILTNGMTILVKPCHTIPRVEAHLLYKVGAKDEEYGQKGIAHFIEHMLFKGTRKLSETDINLITHKLTGAANAFTSHDYTGYTFRLPSNCLDVALGIFAECMQHARFDEQMIASEVKTVIEELRMYRDDYQNYLIEAILASMWPEHPYHSPVVGSHYDLCNLTREQLLNFYHQHYHPSNATLVVVGDIEANLVFNATEKHFGHIKNPEKSIKQPQHFFRNDLASQNTTIYRQINTPWCCCMYQIPGSIAGANYLYDIASLILGNGKSSRLYRRLVDQEQLAIDIDSSLISFFEKGLLCISYYPSNIHNITTIEKIVEEELEKLCSEPIEDWEFHGAIKKAQFDYSSLLENIERQAAIIGTSYLATHNGNFLKDYFTGIAQLTQNDLQTFFKTYLNPRISHKGYLLPMQEADVERYQNIQQETETFENEILNKHQRTTSIEPGKWIHNLVCEPPQAFDYPKPEQFRLANGLEVVYHHNPMVPNIAMVLKLKANPLYDPSDREGAFLFLLRLLTDCSAQYSSEELNQLLESNGIFISLLGDCLACQCLSEDFEKSLALLIHLLTEPSFKEQNIEKIKAHILNELAEYWDTPIEYVDQIAHELMYQQHPYSRPPIGKPESIKNINAQDLQACYQKFITPEAATLVIVGNLNTYNLQEILTHHVQMWTGLPLNPININNPIECTPQSIHIPSPRDQVVVAFAAPSLARTDKNFNYLALLDIVLTGGSQGSSNSRLFELRERTGLFYAIGGSLIHGSREAPGLMFIKTLVSADKVEEAKKLILDTLDELGKNGITQEEFSMAKNLALASSVELFENNMNIAQTFLFLKRFNLNFNLFDKQAETLSILKLDTLHELARKYCNRDHVSIITIGRSQSS